MDRTPPAPRLGHRRAVRPKENPHTGALPIFGTGWYRKRSRFPKAAKGRDFSVQFDGAMSNATVWLNGQELGAAAVRLHQLRFRPDANSTSDSQENVLAVRLTPEDHSSRWYPGRRHLSQRLADVTGPVHVAHWGTYVTTPEVTDEKAAVAVKTEVRTAGQEAARSRCETSVVDAAGKQVAHRPATRPCPPAATQTVAQPA